MKFPLRPAAVVWFVASLALAPAASAVTVANGDFETGDFTGWTLFGNTGSNFVGVDGAAPQGGRYAAYFGPFGAVGGISQLLSTAAGMAYDVGFWLKSESDVNGVSVPNSFVFSWGGAPVVSLADLAPGNYTYYSSHLIAAGSSTSISFGFQSDPAFLDLDSVTVAASVPEPSAGALFAVGALALVGYQLRRARRRAQG